MVDATCCSASGCVAIVEGLALALAPGAPRAALEAIAPDGPRAPAAARAPGGDGRHRPCLGVAGVKSCGCPALPAARRRDLRPGGEPKGYPRGPAVRPSVATRRRRSWQLVRVAAPRRRPLHGSLRARARLGRARSLARRQPQGASAPLRVDPGPRFVPESFAELSDRLSPAVVNITTTTTVAEVDDGMRPILPPGSPFEDFFRDFMDRQPGEPRRQQRSNALGSGFIISPDGYIVTNNHVIESADEIAVELFHGGNLDARRWSAATPAPTSRSSRSRATSRCPSSSSATATPPTSATGCSPSATRSARASRSRPASSRRATARCRAATTTSSRPTPRSTAATPAARSST